MKSKCKVPLYPKNNFLLNILLLFMYILTNWIEWKTEGTFSCWKTRRKSENSILSGSLAWVSQLLQVFFVCVFCLFSVSSDTKTIYNSCDTQAKVTARIEFSLFLRIFQHKNIPSVSHSIQLVRMNMESNDMFNKKLFLGYNRTLHALFSMRKMEISRKSFLTHPTASKPFPMNSSPQKTYIHEELGTKA